MRGNEANQPPPLWDEYAEPDPAVDALQANFNANVAGARAAPAGLRYADEDSGSAASQRSSSGRTKSLSLASTPRAPSRTRAQRGLHMPSPKRRSASPTEDAGWSRGTSVIEQPPPPMRVPLPPNPHLDRIAPRIPRGQAAVRRRTHAEWRRNARNMRTMPRFEGSAHTGSAAHSDDGPAMNWAGADHDSDQAHSAPGVGQAAAAAPPMPAPRPRPARSVAGSYLQRRIPPRRLARSVKSRNYKDFSTRGSPSQFKRRHGER